MRLRKSGPGDGLGVFFSASLLLLLLIISCFVLLPAPLCAAPVDDRTAKVNPFKGDSTMGGDAYMAIGGASEAQGEGASAVGAEAKAMAEQSNAFGAYNEANAGFSSAFGWKNIVTAVSGDAFGYHNTVSGAGGSAFGYENAASGDLSSAFGRQNRASGVQSIAFGAGNAASGERSGVFGADSIASGTDSLALGIESIASGDYSTAAGISATAGGARSIAFGYKTDVNVEDGVALGSSSVADRAAFSSDTEAPFSGFVLNGTNTLGAVSVGSGDKKRQIINVADATEDTDAVNLRQLRGSAEKPITFKGDTGEVDKKLGESFDIIGDGTNIATSVDGGKMKIALNDDISVNNITATGNIEAASFISGGKTYINADGLNANDKKIINVAAGENDTDASNFGQLKAVDDKVETVSSDVEAIKTEVTSIGDRPITFAADTGSADRKLGETFNINGDGNNISTSIDGSGDLTIAMSETPNFGSVAVNSGDAGTVEGLTNTALTDSDFATKGRAATEEQLAIVDDKVEILSGDLSAVKSDVTANTVKIDAVSGDLAAVKTEVTANTVKIDAVSGDLAAAKTEVTELGGKVDTLSGDLSAVKSDVTANTVKIDAVSSDLSAVKTEVTELGGKVDTLSGDLSAVKSDVTANTVKIDAVSGDLATAKTEVTELGGKVDTLSGDVAALGNKPITFAADTGSADRKLGETFNINGDGVNVLTEIDGSGDLTVKLNESLTFGDIKINESGDATITGLNNKTIDGADFADDSGRAATEEQLKHAMDAMSFDIKAGNNIDVTKTNDGVKDEYTVALKDDIEVTSVKADSVTANEYKVGGEIYIDNRGINANNKTITNVAAGELSATSTEAVNGRQLWETNERVSKNESAIRRIDGNVRNLSDRVVELDDDIKDTGALSAALAGLRPIDYNPYEPTQIMASLGYYRDSYGVALGVAHYTQQSTMWHAGLSFGSGSHVMANAGVTFTLGRTEDGKGIQSGGYQVIKRLTTENALLKQNVTTMENKLDAQDALIRKLMEEVEELKKTK